MKNAHISFKTDESLPIESPQHSEDFASTELNFEESPKSAVALSVYGINPSISGSAANQKSETVATT